MIMIDGKEFGTSERPLPVVTVDEKRTSRREDGFFLKDNLLILTWLQSLSSTENIQNIISCLKNRERNFRLSSYKFDQFGIDRIRPSNVFFLKISFDTPNSGELGLCYATRESNILTDRPMLNDGQAKEADRFMSALEAKSLVEAVANSSTRINATCENLFRNNNIPFVGRADYSKGGKVYCNYLVNDGIFSVTGPLRRPSSAINNLQLSSFLEKGSPLFSENKMRRFVK